MQKFLPILFLEDENSELSRELILNSIYHLSILNNGETNKKNFIKYNDLINSNLKFIPKILVSSSETILSKLISDFSEYDIYFIGEPKSRIPFGINIAIDINEIILDRKIEGSEFISKIEVEELLNTNYTDSKNVSIILTGKITSANDSKLSINKLKSIKKIDNYVLNTKITFLGKLNKFSENYLNLDNYIEIDDIDKIKYDKVFNSKIYNLVDDRYNEHWYALSKYNNFDEVNIIMNLSKIKSKSLDIIDQIRQVLNSTRETIYVSSDIAIGTKRIIEHYCNMYNCYGNYVFKSIDIRVYYLKRIDIVA